MPMLGVMVVGLLTVVGLGRLGGAVCATARADAIADLVALAGAVGGLPAATSVASANGSVLRGFSAVPGGGSHRVQVRVDVNGITASAAAAAV